MLELIRWATDPAGVSVTQIPQFRPRGRDTPVTNLGSLTSRGPPRPRGLLGPEQEVTQAQSAPGRPFWWGKAPPWPKG